MAASKKSVSNQYLKKASGSGRDFRPSPGGSGKIPSGTAGSGPKPTPAHNSGTKKPFPAHTNDRTNLPLRKGL